MKRYIPTLLLVVICIGLFWYTGGRDFYEETSEESSQRLFAFEQDDVNKMMVKWNEQEVDMNRQDDKWVMEKPAAYPVNPNMVSSFLESLSGISQDMIVEDNASDLGKYGLEKPSGEYEVTLKDGSKQLLRIGDELPVPGNYYATIDQSKRVYRVGASSVQALQKEPLHFVARTPVSFNSDQVTDVTFHWNKEEWSMSKASLDQTAILSKWKLGDQELDGSKANMLLDKISFLATEQLMKPASEISMKAPELTITIKMTQDGTSNTITLQGKIEGDQVWVVSSGGQWAYAIALSEVQTAFDQANQLK
ncbi:DUF4340 domain-containing protein [Paenibacillus sp. N1-5-1-14]|uniref:DUF4340 domain-containing protein n=1 Tax=Paenibacillus radicibacter TaxID=2972488 RepID=UPI00215968DA|nr:DUF4340 domain-containing protein [Paenibacillus radicibacter]MCR8644966.1 DUF4340 domain-containing protein [Paenibacillus radicibacter]